MNSTSNTTLPVILIPAQLEPSSYIVWRSFIMYIAPSPISLLATLMSAIIWARVSFGEHIDRYLFTINLSDFIYILTQTICSTFRFTCMASPLVCGSDAQKVTSWFYYATFFYLGSSLSLFSTLLEIFLSVQRITIMMNIRFFRQLKFDLIVGIVTFICLIYNIPILLGFTVVTTGRIFSYRDQLYIEYGVRQTDFGRTSGIVLLNLISIGRIILVLIVMLVLNIITIILYNRLMRHRIQMVHASSTTSTPTSRVIKVRVARTREDIANRGVTLMLISTAFLYILGNLVFRVVNINTITPFIFDPVLLTNLTNAGFFFLYLFPGLKIFVYLIFMKPFRLEFSRILPINRSGFV